ncbi:hypothetical protein KR009_008163, partial [Drosophila setifemur]
MQRSSKYLMADCILRPRLQLKLVIGRWRDMRRTFASESFKGSSRSGSTAGMGTGTGTAAGTGGGASASAGPTASATSTISAGAANTNVGSIQRRINREDNMWRDRSYIDTKWLNPRDPLAYRPNFRQTEPVSLRKQFMRSPDEISREVLGRDWEDSFKTYKRDGARKAAWEATESSRDWQQQKDLQQRDLQHHQQERVQQERVQQEKVQQQQKSPQQQRSPQQQ